MFVKIATLWTILTLAYAENDGKRWVWSDNNRNEGRNRNDDLARYEVFENGDLFNPNEYNEGPGRPSFVGSRPPASVRPAPNERPGGVYNQIPLGGGYGEGQNAGYYPEERPTGPGVLTGPIPSWVKQGPFKKFDKCKCTERFNCNSPGISYSQCDAGKQYCCYATNKKDQLGEPLPSRPVHSIDNGILVGPGGPVDPIPGVNVQPRPPLLNGPRPGGYVRPGGNYVRPGAAGFGLRPSGGGSNTYSIDNGVLVGPGGPYDRPSRGGYGR